METERFWKLSVRWFPLVTVFAILLFAWRLTINPTRVHENLSILGVSFLIEIANPQSSALIEAFAIMIFFWAMVIVINFSPFVYSSREEMEDFAKNKGAPFTISIACAILFAYQAFSSHDVGLGLLVFGILGFLGADAYRPHHRGIFNLRNLGENTAKRISELIVLSIFGYGVANLIAFGVIIAVTSVIAGWISLVIGIMLKLIVETLSEKAGGTFVGAKNGLKRFVRHSKEWLFVR